MIAKDWINEWTARHNIEYVRDNAHWVIGGQERKSVRLFAPYQDSWHEVVELIARPSFRAYTRIAAALRAALGDTAIDELYAQL